MATNPNNAVGTNGAFGGRTSVNAFNDDLAIYSGRGIISGWACAPSSGLTVVLGGDSSTRDVAVAQDNAGNRTTINNISGAPVSVTLSGAPTANSRIDAIVAYVDNPPQGSATITDNYEACGIIAVAGTPAASPSAPTESAIRSAITADGASGATAYYVVLATVTVAAGTTDIAAGNITAGATAKVSSANTPTIPDGSITASKIDFTTFPATYTTLYSSTSGTSTTATLSDNVSNYDGVYVSGIDSSKGYCSTVFVPKALYSKNNSLTISYAEASYVLYYGVTFTISGTTLTTGGNAPSMSVATNLTFGGVSTVRDSVKIVSVIGVKGIGS